MVGLTAISYTLFFILAVALRYGNVRLYILIPALFIAAGFASLRILHLRLSGRWEYAWSAGIAFIGIQIASGLHYWPLSPIHGRCSSAHSRLDQLAAIVKTSLPAAPYSSRPSSSGYAGGWQSSSNNNEAAINPQ
jgi:hypothetical protein